MRTLSALCLEGNSMLMRHHAQSCGALVLPIRRHLMRGVHTTRWRPAVVAGARFTSTAITRDVTNTVDKLSVIICPASSSSANPPPSTERTATLYGFTFSNGAVYIGDVVNNKRHGTGKMTFPDGKYFDGDWADDKPHGRGTFHIPPPSESLYIGEVRHGKKHGQGQIWGNEWTYEGGWVEDKMGGRGVMAVMKNKSVETREGDFRGGELHGKGKITFTNGVVYTGDVSHGEKHGEGVQHCANGSMYNGDFQHGSQTGHCTITYVDGGVYTGEVMYGKRHGQGTMQHPDGAVYEGAFQYNKKHGHAANTYALKDDPRTNIQKSELGTNGSAVVTVRYVGGYANNMRHGWAIRYFSDGGVSYGLWRNDKRIGSLRKSVALYGGLDYDFAALKAKMTRVEGETDYDKQ